MNVIAWKRLRLLTGLTGLLVGTMATFAGCGALSDVTGDPEMKWVANSDLPEQTETLLVHRAVAALPTLTPEQAAKALGHPAAAGETSRDKTTLAGDGWTVLVKQSPYVTTLRYERPCSGEPENQTQAAEAGGEFLSSLGLDPSGWTWMTFTGADGAARAIAEPNLDETQTWSTGSLSVLSDDKGVCVATAALMGFEATEERTTLRSAEDTFQDVRHDERLTVKGEYESAELTWTLAAEGKVIPLWRFIARDGDGFVAVDLGDGLETAPDTLTYLKASAGQPATK